MGLVLAASAIQHFQPLSQRDGVYDKSQRSQGVQLRGVDQKP